MKLRHICCPGCQHGGRLQRLGSSTCHYSNMNIDHSFYRWAQLWKCLRKAAYASNLSLPDRDGMFHDNFTFVDRFRVDFNSAGGTNLVAEECGYVVTSNSGSTFLLQCGLLACSFTE